MGRETILLSDLKVVLLKSMEEDFQQECREIQERLDEIKALLCQIANTNGWELPVTVMGMEMHYPDYERDLKLLEKCGLVKSTVKYTERNSYRLYVLSEKGEALIKTLT